MEEMNEGAPAALETRVEVPDVANVVRLSEERHAPSADLARDALRIIAL